MVLKMIEQYYKEICQDLGGRLVYQKGFKVPRISYDNGIIDCVCDTYPPGFLGNWVSDPEERRALFRYILSEHTMSKAVTAKFRSYVFDNYGKFREDLTDVKDAFREEPFLRDSVTYNYVGGFVEFLPYLPPIKNISVDDMKDFEKLLFILCGNNKENYQTMLKYIAQYTFETRRNNRPTLILFGDRGAGKNFLVDSILAKIWRTEFKKGPTSFDKFVEFVDSKLVFIDEVRSHDDINMYDMVKNISGSSKVSMRNLYAGNKVVEGKTHMVLSSNGKPIHIPYAEAPRKAKDNQWFCIQYNKPLDEYDDFIRIRNKHAENSYLDPFIDRCLGAFLYEKVYPIYRELVDSNMRTRYGFEIPINDALMDLRSRGETDLDSTLWYFFEQIYHIYTLPDLEYTSENRMRTDIEVRNFNYYKNYRLDLLDLIRNHNFIATPIVAAYCDREKTITIKKFRSFMKKFDLIKNDSVRKGGVRGIIFDAEKVRERVEEAVDVDIDFDENVFDF